MRRLGADCSVVVMKRGNARGAKGAGHRHWVGSTGNGRSPTLNGRRQPSRGGTSRMTRECHVRICERLGVKFPVAAGKAANLVGERPMPSIARFGRLAYPMRGEVTNRAVRLNTKAARGLDKALFAKLATGDWIGSDKTS